MGTMNKLALAAVICAAPLAARADIGLRIGPELNVAYNNGSGTHFLTDNWPLNGTLMLSYWTPGQVLSVDVEVAEEFFLSTSSGTGFNTRYGTVIRPGLRLSPPILPVYLRAALPLNVETNAPGGRETADLRLGAGITIPLVLFKIYIEGDADFPLGAGGASTGAFSQWNLLLNAGLDFRF